MFPLWCRLELRIHAERAQSHFFNKQQLGVPEVTTGKHFLYLISILCTATYDPSFKMPVNPEVIIWNHAAAK